MSYSCYISFKTIEPEDVFSFLLEVKKKTIEMIPEIAKENFIFSPFSRKNVEYNSEFQDEASEERRKIFKEADAWALICFSHKLFYIPEHNLLGVFSMPDCMHDIFDCTICFQNSCDQDYEYSTWDKVALFKGIAEKWETMSDDEVFKKYSDKYGERDREDFFSKWNDYYRKTYAYEEIWKLLENYLYEESATISFQVIDNRDFSSIRGYTSCCLKEYETWHRKIEEECKK